MTTGVGAEGIALDVATGKMYFTALSGSKIQRSNLDGSNVEEIMTGGDILSARRIALDLSLGKIYWTDDNRGIERANLDGSAREVIIQSQSPNLGGFTLALPTSTGSIPAVSNIGLGVMIALLVGAAAWVMSKKQRKLA